jgi:hypothetical protein
MKLGTVFARSAMVAAALAMSAGTARADGVLGQPVFKAGDIAVRFVGSEAAYGDDLYFFLTVGQFSDAQFLFDNHASTPGEFVDVDDSGLAMGDEAIFGICVRRDGTSPAPGCPEADDIFYSGDGSRNGDGLPHMIVWTRAEYIALTGTDLEGMGIGAEYDYVIGFEDILGGGDEDYNDAIFAVRGVTTVPEPVTMTLLATGLAGMGGAGVLKRRRK